ncbi:hypothetical protein HOA92_01415 [archaeon]|jgi:hypothetical protein|nr:hypothetical protein [archaeon]MBT6761675.1 hypothetical protein [archaeon]
MANGKDLRTRIGEYLDEHSPGGKIYQKRRSLEQKAAYDFAKPIAELFNSEEMSALLDHRPGLEVQLFSHYTSSMGAAMGGSPPSYEILVDKSGLCVKRDGEVSERHVLPAILDTWVEVVPYGGQFHDSSSGDYEFKPSSEKFMDYITRQMGEYLK